MIPPFDETGCLPLGVHRPTIEEIDERFARQSEIRRVQMDSIRWMLDLARRAGVQRVVLNGSFVTDTIEPNDVDCVLLAADDPAPDEAAERELTEPLPFLEVLLVRQENFDKLVDFYFAADRYGVPKGMVEVMQWT